MNAIHQHRMVSITRLWYFTVLCIPIVIFPFKVRAQLTSSMNVTVVPFVDQVQDSVFVDLAYNEFLNTFNPGSSFNVLDTDRVLQFMGDRSSAEVLSDVHSLAGFAAQTNSAFVVGGIVRAHELNGIEICIAIYCADDKAVLTEETRQYPTQVEAIHGVLDLARTLSHPKFYTPSDTAFFYSLVLPGTGQLSLGRWDHAIMCWGLLIPSIVYSLTTPTPDSYTFPNNYFVEEWNATEEQWHFYFKEAEVSLEEYLQEYSQATQRAATASEDRESVRKRKRLSTWLVASAWLVNLADTILVSRRKGDNNRFFPLLNVGSSISTNNSSRFISIQLCIHF